jgi:hypothetical protein
VAVRTANLALREFFLHELEPIPAMNEVTDVVALAPDMVELQNTGIAMPAISACR